MRALKHGPEGDEVGGMIVDEQDRNLVDTLRAGRTCGFDTRGHERQVRSRRRWIKHVPNARPPWPSRASDRPVAMRHAYPKCPGTADQPPVLLRGTPKESWRWACISMPRPSPRSAWPNRVSQTRVSTNMD